MDFANILRIIELSKFSTHRRNNCRLCSSSDLALAVDMEAIPPQELYFDTASEASAVPRYPVDLYFCNNCSHVQQLDILNSNALWNDYTYESGKAKGMSEHFQDFSSSVLEEYPCQSKDDYVLDIGSNDGTLLTFFKDSGYQVLGVDPAKSVADIANAKGVNTIPDFFNKKLVESVLSSYGKAKIITAFNAFAHADDLDEIASSIKLLLDYDGVFYFEVQYLVDIVEKVLIGSIFHEHMSHHSLTPLIKFLKKHGLEIVDIERNNIQNGALIGKVKHIRQSNKVAHTVTDLVELESRLGVDNILYIKRLSSSIEMIKRDVATFLKKADSGIAIAGYGAARSGQTLITQTGLEGVIEYIFDDHPKKLGKYPAGDGIKVVPTKRLLLKQPEYTVVLAWVHVRTIIKKNVEYLRRGGEFLVLTPTFNIVNNDNYEHFLEYWG